MAALHGSRHVRNGPDQASSRILDRAAADPRRLAPRCALVNDLGASRGQASREQTVGACASACEGSFRLAGVPVLRGRPERFAEEAVYGPVRAGSG